jgi:hypothetical protein
MRITGLERLAKARRRRDSASSTKSVAALLIFAAGLMPAAEKTPFTSLANLSSALSANDADSALEYFDSNMQSYGQIEQKLEALTAQDDISCAIDVVTDVETDGVHKLDLDWFMQLKSQADFPQIERRRERVQVQMRQFKGVWKITSISPIGILDPIKIQ